MSIVYSTERERIGDTYLAGLVMQIGELSCTVEAHHVYAKGKQNPIAVFRNNLKLGCSVTFRLSKQQSLFYNARKKEIRVGNGSLTFAGQAIEKVLEWLTQIEGWIPEGYVFEAYTEFSPSEMKLRNLLKN